jgi:hypothetical protein
MVVMEETLKFIEILEKMGPKTKRNFGAGLAYAFDSYNVAAKTNPKGEMIIMDVPEKYKKSVNVYNKLMDGMENPFAPPKQDIKNREIFKKINKGKQQNQKELVKNIKSLNKKDLKVVGEEVKNYLNETKHLFGRNVTRNVIKDIRKLKAFIK